MNIEQAMYVNHEAVHLALTMCCGGATRYDLRRPFIGPETPAGRYVYASNGIIIARVPAWAAPWVTDTDYKGRQIPGCHELPWAPELYSNAAAPWAKFPKPIVNRCDRCIESHRGDYDPDSKPSVWELCDFADPQQICCKCGMYTASEVGSDYALGKAWFNARQCRKLATLGAVMYMPRVVDKDTLAAWRWEIPDLKMVGLLMPVKRSEG